MKSFSSLVQHLSLVETQWMEKNGMYDMGFEKQMSGMLFIHLKSNALLCDIISIWTDPHLIIPLVNNTRDC
jgi:hypothetical protein